MNPIEQNATKILTAIIENDNQNGEERRYDGNEINKMTGIESRDINDAVEFLDDRSLIETLKAIGTKPYRFALIEVNSRGRYVYYETQKQIEESDRFSKESVSVKLSENVSATSPLPAGSPFGFTDQDWEYVQTLKRMENILYVVMGMQFESEKYDTEELKRNIKFQFENAVENYNKKSGLEKIVLNFKPLSAGYGEHLFNQIARDIISSDIAVFETSDSNPNVMVELGVALTWGIRVLPLLKDGGSTPPSDLSGLTWVKYRNNGSEFISDFHDDEMVSMVERAIQKK